MSEVKITEYKGKPTLTLNPNDSYPFSFQMAKAKMIVENIDAIKAFVATNGKSLYVNEVDEPNVNHCGGFIKGDKIENILTGEKGSVTSTEDGNIGYWSENGKMVFVDKEELTNYQCYYESK